MSRQYDDETRDRAKRLIADLTKAGHLPPALDPDSYLSLWDIALRHMADAEGKA